MKKRGRKKRSDKEVAEKSTDKFLTQVHKPSKQAENAFDFGGIPDIDLKKNLGCG